MFLELSARFGDYYHSLLTYININPETQRKHFSDLKLCNFCRDEMQFCVYFMGGRVCVCVRVCSWRYFFFLTIKCLLTNTTEQCKAVKRETLLLSHEISAKL